MHTITIDDLPGLIGKEIGVSDWFTVDQDRINAFAEVTGDHQWIHVDVERATREIGGPIAHGFLTLSLAPMLAADLLRIEGVTRGVNYGLNRARFLNPVAAGARIRVRVVLLSSEPKAGGLALTRTCTIEIEGHDKPALVAEMISVIYG